MCIPKILACLAILGATFSFAQAGRRRALIIGNNEYATDGFEKLQHIPLRDADAMEQVLMGLGFNRSDIKTLHNVRQAELKAELLKFQKSLEPDDSALFYFSGHGFSVNRADFLVPIDFSLSRKRRAQEQSVGLDDVIQSLSVAKRRVVILDACRDESPLLKSIKNSAARLPALLVPLDKPGNLIGYATGAGQTSSARSDDGNLSLYTSFLVEALRDHPREMFDALETAKTLTIKASKGKQTPVVSDMIDGFPLTNTIVSPMPGQEAQQLSPVSPPPQNSCPANGALATGWTLEKVQNDWKLNYFSDFQQIGGALAEHMGSFRPYLGSGAILPNTKDIDALIDDIRSRVAPEPRLETAPDGTPIPGQSVTDFVSRSFNPNVFLTWSYSIKIEGNTIAHRGPGPAQVRITGLSQSSVKTIRNFDARVRSEVDNWCALSFKDLMTDKISRHPEIQAVVNDLESTLQMLKEADTRTIRDINFTWKNSMMARGSGGQGLAQGEVDSSMTNDVNSILGRRDTEFAQVIAIRLRPLVQKAQIEAQYNTAEIESNTKTFDRLFALASMPVRMEKSSGANMNTLKYTELENYLDGLKKKIVDRFTPR